MDHEPQLRANDLHDVHERLRDLYRVEYPDGAPHLYERLLEILPNYIRALVMRKLDLLVSEEVESLRSHVALSSEEKSALAMFLDPQVLRAHLEAGRDSTLSNHTHSIAHFDTQPPIVAHELLSAAASDNPEKLQRTGCIFFDVDGTKTLVECTSHSHAGRYLEKLAEFLCKLPAHVMQWLQNRRLSSQAYSYAGDEFIMVLRSEDQPVEKSTLDEFALLVRKAAADDPALASCMSFDDPDFAMEYDSWSDADRDAYRRDPSSMTAKLKESRDKLPERFIPSLSSGSATFYEALQIALSPDTETPGTLEELGINAFRLMVATADERLKEDKRIFRETLDDPKLLAFLLRNRENRDLQAVIDDMTTKLNNALHMNAELKAKLDQ